MGEGDLAQSGLVALSVHLLHERADHQLAVQTWKTQRDAVSIQQAGAALARLTLNPPMPGTAPYLRR